ncbi:MAG: glycoside hydrolase family 127 protein, partial [Candidatus Latescibacteria bacterium]|nr:glycoside hydrolase family 127 protein [Candidatus Latescibacterota bacterium]
MSTSITSHGRHRRMQPLPLRDVTIDDEFWTPRITVNREQTLDYQLAQCEETGRIRNFLKAAGTMDGEFEGIFFNDSDVYKWVEAASYSLTTHPDPALDRKLDDVIAAIAAAQQEGGYLNTYFILKEPDKKWTNLGVMHELYCAGHLFQAAVAHYQGTGKRSLLDVACRLADHIDRVFGPGKRNGMPGHEEIELALVDLYRVTGETRYLNLAQFFIDQRGRRPSVFDLEIADPNTGGNVDINRALYLVNGQYDGRYSQDDQPVREQDKVAGHAVRAMYLYCGMADIVGETGEPALRDALERLWANLTLTRMYVTGGIGPSSHNEGFTEDYHLPNTTAYAETCAAVGSILWNHRMLMLNGDVRFADVMEQALYNGFLSGLALDGKHYFYQNPLRSNGDRMRQGWFGCACCPPNIARLLASLGTYIYSQSND